MKNPKQKTKYRGAGFAVRAALLAVLAVGCFAMCCSFTHAWFITERGTEQNTVETATYGVTVTDSAGTVLTDGKYVCPLAPEDLHTFTLQAAGTAYTGHCIVGVTAPGASEVSYVVELAPDQSGAVSLQSAKGSLLSFSFDWGEGENPVEPANVFGRDDTLLFYIENSRTPHLLYEVAYGATPAGIATYYKVNVEDLCTYNGLDLAAANTPIYPGQGGKLTYEIPYPDLKKEELPDIVPYVPRGDLIVAMKSAGDAAVPEDAVVLVSGPNNYVKTIPYSLFVSDVQDPAVVSCLLNDLPAGEYRITVGNVEMENYTLVTSGTTDPVAVHENDVTVGMIVNTYTRHKGNLIFELSSSDANVTIPDDAELVFFGPDGNFSVSCSELTRGSIVLEQLPTGQYTVVLNNGSVDYYDLIKGDMTLTIEQDETTIAELVVVYQRQVGTMKFEMVAIGHEIPADTYLRVVSPDESSFTIPYTSFVDGVFTKTDALAGEYSVQLVASKVDGYDLIPFRTYFTVTKNEVSTTEIEVEYKRHQGDAEIQMEVEGNTVPDSARVILTDAAGTAYRTSYVRFDENSFTVQDLPTGEYTVTLEGAGIEGYDLSVTAEKVVVVKGETVTAPIKVKYTRQVGTLNIVVNVNNAEITLPDTAVLKITDPDGKSSSEDCASCQLTNLPTGVYTVSVSGVDLDGYTVTAEGGSAELTKEGATINVNIVYTPVQPTQSEQSTEGTGNEQA